jgi:hypothetical protein
VIAYAYLWAREHRRGLEEGRKDRPCAIVAARQMIEGCDVVTVPTIRRMQSRFGGAQPTISCGQDRISGQTIAHLRRKLSRVERTE